MRNVSTIQLLLSKYLMWPSRLSAQCLSCFAAGDSSLSFLGNAQPACVHVRARQQGSCKPSTVCINGRTCAGMECVCVCVPCPPVLLVSIIHSFVDDLTLLGLASNSRQNLLSSPNLFLSSPRYLSIAVPAPATLSVPYCIFSYPSPCISTIQCVSVTISSYPIISAHCNFFQISSFLPLIPPFF